MRAVNMPAVNIHNTIQIRLWIALLLSTVLLALGTQSAAAHGALPPKDQAIPILAETESGSYRISATQYAVNEFWILDVPVAFVNGDLPADTRAEATIVCLQSGETKTIRLLRIQDTFIGRLPIVEETWQVTMIINGAGGVGSVEFATAKHYGAAVSSPLVRGVVIGVPFLLILLGLLAYRRFGLALVE